MFVIFLWILSLYVVINTGHCEIKDIEPGQCLSKFDYDYKMMQQMLQLEVQVSEQSKEIERLKQKNSGSDVQSVAFMAQLSRSIVNPPTGTIVVFDDVHTNVGNGYKSGPGTFVAPVDATYSISLVASTNRKGSSDNLHLYIMHNKSQVGYIFLDRNAISLIRFTTAVLELSAGDTIFVKVGNNHPVGTIVGCCFHTILSGFMIK